MSEPIDFQIVTRLQAALRGINVADGYFFNVAAGAVKLDPNADVDALLSEGDSRGPLLFVEVLEDAPDYAPDNQVFATLRCRVHWFGDSNPTEDDARIKTYLRACADIERAIVATLGFGGLAKDSRIVRRGYDTSEDGARVWAIVELAIGYERQYGAP